MSIYQICFSPTGGTRRVAEMVSGQWAGEKIAVDLARADEDFSHYVFQETDICLVAVPSYGGRVPKVALERLGRMTGGQARAVLVVAYGNRAYEDTLLELADTLQGAGFRCCAAVAAVAEHSIMRQFGTGRPDAQDERELQGFARQIQEKLVNGTADGPLQLPGNRPYRTYDGVPFKPKANGKKCTKCGLCAAKCPTGAIDKANPAVTDESKCISCMGCVAACPRQARQLNKVMLFVAARKMKKVCGERKGNRLFL